MEGSGQEPREVRASDVDRDRVAPVLNDALDAIAGITSLLAPRTSG